MLPPLVVLGLGNPGPAYAGTRHNAGAMLVDTLAARLGLELRRRRGQFRSAEGELEGRPVVLAVPTTYMNESGRAAHQVVRKAGVGPQDLLVCHDELDLPLGRVRLKVDGGTAGHRGLESVCASLRSRDFLRLRIGIGRPPPGEDPVDYVLARFRPEEREVLEASIEAAIAGLGLLARAGVDAAQGFLHSRT